MRSPAYVMLLCTCPAPSHVIQKLIEFEFLFTLVHVPGTRQSVHFYGLISLLMWCWKPFSKTLSLLMALQYYLLSLCLLLLNNILAGSPPPPPNFSLLLHSRKALKIVVLTILCWGEVRMTALFITSCIMNCQPPTSACLLTPGELVA